MSHTGQKHLTVSGNRNKIGKAFTENENNNNSINVPPFLGFRLQTNQNEIQWHSLDYPLGTPVRSPLRSPASSVQNEPYNIENELNVSANGDLNVIDTKVPIVDAVDERSNKAMVNFKESQKRRKSHPRIGVETIGNGYSPRATNTLFDNFGLNNSNSNIANINRPSNDANEMEVTEEGHEKKDGVSNLAYIHGGKAEQNLNQNGFNSKGLIAASDHYVYSFKESVNENEETMEGAKNGKNSKGFVMQLDEQEDYDIDSNYNNNNNNNNNNRRMTEAEKDREIAALYRRIEELQRQ